MMRAPVDGSEPIRTNCPVRMLRRHRVRLREEQYTYITLRSDLQEQVLSRPAAV